MRARLTAPAPRPYPACMSETPDIHDLARQLAVLEERMNTQQAKYEGALDRFRAETTSALDRLRADMANRETRMLLAMAAMIGLGVAIIGFLV